MKLKRFIQDHLIQIAILLFVIFTIEVFLSIYQMPVFIYVYVFISIVLGYSVMLIIEYYKKNKFYQSIYSQLEQLDQKYLLPEVIKKPNFVEGKILNDLMIEMEQSMLFNVNNYKKLNLDYKSYIELWVHEIKTPLAVLKMIVENNPSELTYSIKEELDKIEKYIEQTLFYARSTCVEKDYLVKPVELKKTVYTTIKKFQNPILTNKIQLKLHDLDYIVYSDSKWIEFILSQIIDNSIKYISIDQNYIEIYCISSKNAVELVIKDNGIGINKQDLNRVFEKGFTGENGRTHQKATGLGLYLCNQLCQKLGLNLKINSQNLKGCEVIITFPVSNMTKM